MRLKIPSNLKTFLNDYIGVDYRSLALMRIFSCLVVLTDLIARIPNLSAHYGIGGVLPPDALSHVGSGQSRLPFLPLIIANVPHFPLLVFTVSFICICFVLIGYRTYIATILAWICILI